MKKYITLSILASLSCLTLIGCAQKNDTTNNNNVTNNQNSEKSTAETVSFFADGEYKGGIDINPGSYYMVLTDLQYHEDHASKKEGYILTILNEKDDEKLYEMIETLGKAYKVNITKDSVLTFESNYDPIWNITFFTAEDYQEYQSTGKK